VLRKNSEGKLAITKMIIRPTIVFDSDNAPDENVFIKMHKEAHSKCFIANSIKSEIEIIPNLEIE
jgi:organic hydroperoxide reductase OsmC/OhrA